MHKHMDTCITSVHGCERHEHVWYQTLDRSECLDIRNETKGNPLWSFHSLLIRNGENANLTIAIQEDISEDPTFLLMQR